MNITIHPDAQKSFDAKAQNLVTLIQEFSLPPVTPQAPQPEFYISGEINQQDIIGDIELSYVNHLGQEVGKVFYHDKKPYGIRETSYMEFEKVAENIQKLNSLKDILSIDFVKKELFAWMIQTFQNTTIVPFINYLLERTKSEIQPYQIWIPIPYTTTESQFPLGKLIFKTLTKEQIESWFAEVNHQIPADAIEEEKQKVQKKFQGHLIAIYECTAEPLRANELAFYHLNNSLSILRLLSPSNHILDVLSGSGTYEYGQNMRRSRTYFITQDNKLSQTISGLIDTDLRWDITNFEVGFINSDEFKNFHLLLNNDALNEFQKKLFDALLIYSKNTLKKELFDKILYILVALESLLLKNDSEPIQQNIADRISFAIGKSADEKREIVQTIKDIYSIRSKFIHHGTSSFQNRALIQKFMNYAWFTFLFLVQQSHDFETKDKCIFALDHIKYS